MRSRIKVVEVNFFFQQDKPKKVLKYEKQGAQDDIPCQMANDVREKSVRLSLGTKRRKFMNLSNITCVGSTKLLYQALLTGHWIWH